jgi:multicomponent K+:H+ antiporter subunit D
VATLGFAAVGMLASQPLGRIAGYSVIASSGMVIAACGFDAPALTAGALFYLASSTLATAALFLIVELVDRSRQAKLDMPATDDADDHLPDFVEGEPPQDVNLDDEEVALTGRAIPAAIAFLGLAFLFCALVVSGLPPLSGFVGKVAMLSALLDTGLLTGGEARGWALFAMIIVSGLLAAMAFVRIGLRHFWAPIDRAAPRLRVVEFAAVALLLGGCTALVVAADPALRYLRATAVSLHEPARYVNAVLAARPADGRRPVPSTGDSTAVEAARPEGLR